METGKTESGETYVKDEMSSVAADIRQTFNKGKDK